MLSDILNHISILIIRRETYSSSQITDMITKPKSRTGKEDYKINLCVPGSLLKCATFYKMSVSQNLAHSQLTECLPNTIFLQDFYNKSRLRMYQILSTVKDGVFSRSTGR